LVEIALKDNILMADSTFKPLIPISAQVLRLVGIILILSFFLDFIVTLAIVPQFDNLQWRLNFANAFIDRGLTPLIGFALLYAGFWIQLNTHGISAEASMERAAWQDWRFWAFVFSSVLGLLFLLVIVFYFNVTGQIVDQLEKQVNDQVTQQLNRLEQESRQYKAWVANGQVEQILKSNQLPTDLQMLLRQAQQTPQVLDQVANSKKQQVLAAQAQTLGQARGDIWQNRIRMGIRSFLASIGFITIGWSGLRDSR
jgi:hypothetical protein